MVAPIILKDDNRLPDYFTITIHYITGKTETFNIAEISYVEQLMNLNNQAITNHYDVFRFWTYEDRFYERVKANIIGIDYDENYTKIVRIQKEMQTKK